MFALWICCLVRWIVTDWLPAMLTGWQGVYLICLFVVLTIGSSVVYCVVHWYVPCFVFGYLFVFFGWLRCFSFSVICYKCPAKETLQDLLDQSELCLTVEEVWIIAYGIIRAMAYLWSKQIVHNAISTRSIIIARNVEVSNLLLMLIVLFSLPNSFPLFPLPVPPFSCILYFPSTLNRKCYSFLYDSANIIFHRYERTF